MRKQVKVICLSRMGYKVGSMVLNTHGISETLDATELFEKHKETIKKLYPTAVKVKIIY
ncbi:hypothetical protein F4826_004754 [Rahnella inusitata]|nr:hypothetical protein [Rahnella inusitata]